MAHLTPLPTPARTRVALYGHDTLGLGHLRRNLALASAFAADRPGSDAGDGADVLLLTGAAEVGMFERPEGVDALVVPGVQKDDAGGYAPRRLRTHLAGVVELRRSMLTNALLSFAPDLLVVDKAPWGFGGELADVLPQLAAMGTRLVLGLRDVLDDPEVAAREWREDGSEEAVIELYDEVWIYGDRRVHDVTAACAMSSAAAAKCRHVGYLSEGRPTTAARHRPLGDRPYVLVTLGGGQDGENVARAAAELEASEDHDIVILTGPQMPADVIAEVRAATADHPGVHVHRFSRHGAAWAANAEAVIAMGGANTVAEQLVTDVPTLVVPRVTPRLEQWVRADALSRCGLLDVLHPDELSTGTLAAWIADNAGDRVDRSSLRLDGLRTVRTRAERLIEDTEAGTAQGPFVPLRAHPPRVYGIAG